MIALLDVNVLIALAWRSHAHHLAAWEWFEEHREQGWATCLLTEAGFVRVSCNRLPWDERQRRLNQLDY